MSAQKTLVAFSGGKDSTASVILAHELQIPIDEIVFCEVMYDKERKISAEHPCHIDHIITKCFPTFERWGYKVRVLRNADWDFLSLFHKKIEKSSYPDRIGKDRGFPLSTACWCKRDLKVNVIEAFNRENPDAVTIVGICADEPARLRSLYRQPNKRSILAENGFTQADARALCEEYDLLSPIYRFTNRSGCWYCPWVKNLEWAAVPEELRKELIMLEESSENVSGAAWNPHRGRLRDL